MNLDIGNVMVTTMVACTAMAFIVIFVLVGFRIYKRSIERKKYLLIVQSWPSTSGRIIESALNVYRSGGRHGGSIHEIKVEYEYTVNGQLYKNNLVKAGDQFIVVYSVFVNNSMEERIKRYPVGAQVTVYYNPANPGESALER
jgi:cytochrome bd-type quinol oxidase subunit 1